MLYLVRVDDAHARACLELLAEAGVSAVRERPIAPERTWPLTGPELGSLPQRVVLVGADPVLERRLHLSGRQVTVLDERRLVLDGRLHANRSGPRLVELERLLGCRLFDEERRAEVLAFARGGIDVLRRPGTVAAGVARTVGDDQRARAEAAGESLPPGSPEDRISRLPAMPKVLAVGRKSPQADRRRLLLAIAPADHRLSADGDLLLAGTIPDLPDERLWVFHDRDGRPRAVELVLPAARAAIVEQWLEQLLRRTDAVSGIVAIHDERAREGDGPARLPRAFRHQQRAFLDRTRQVVDGHPDDGAEAVVLRRFRPQIADVDPRAYVLALAPRRAVGLAEEIVGVPDGGSRFLQLVERLPQLAAHVRAGDVGGAVEVARHRRVDAVGAHAGLGREHGRTDRDGEPVALHGIPPPRDAATR